MPNFSSATECLASVCKQHNIDLERVDYNEACDGKDECDRKFALLKSAMRYFRDEGNDILSANDMMNAIIERCFNQNIKCCVIKINSKNTTVTNITKIEGISNIHSIEILQDSFRVWNYFNIGEGSEIRLKNCKFVNGAEVVRKFEDVRKILCDTAERTNKTNKNSFTCEECKRVFSNPIEYEQHLLANISGNCNDSQQATTSNWDKTIEMYKTACNLTNKTDTNSVNEIQQVVVRSENYDEIFKDNWAVKKFKRTRFSKEQKQFLDDCFNKGAKSGN